jgi:hypothetical protein
VWQVEGELARRVPVTIISRRGSTVTVAADLQAGDLVVVEGVQRLREGSKVTRLDGGQPADAASANARESG